ncbi:OsmC family peroxiredoxin [bacterium]|nr:MAG: OsmC family peroxiredoxin [bacterium]
MIHIEWKGGMAFEGKGPSGVAFTMDGIPEVGGKDLGPTPVEALAAALAACSGIDVLSILEKKRQIVTGYRMEVEYDRDPIESGWPRPLKSIRLRHFLSGDNLDPASVERAIELSDEKYCTVAATLRNGAPIETKWTIENRALPVDAVEKPAQ